MLACLILLPALPIISNYIFYTQPLSFEYPHSLFASQALFSLFGPIYLFYCLEMLGKPLKVTKYSLLHALPSFFILISWLVYSLLGETAQMEFAQGFKHSEGTWQILLACWGPILLVMAYLSASAIVIFRHFAQFKDVFTHLENFKMGYIAEFNVVMLIQIILLGFISLFVSIWYLEMVWVPIFSNLLYFYIVYKSYNYGVIFSETDYENFKNRYAPLNQYIAHHKQRYATSGLSNEKVEEYADLLSKGFEEHKWYLNPELNLSLLSEKTNIPSYAISQVINQKLEKNFFDFVNSYRVEALKEHLLDKRYAAIKIEELAFMCGFNSKAAFQRAFKKHTGTTPTLYKKDMQMEMSES